MLLMVLVKVEGSIDLEIGDDDGRILLCVGTKVRSRSYTVVTFGR